jgi:hypothetical protein
MGPLSVTYVCKNLCYILLQVRQQQLPVVSFMCSQLHWAECELSMQMLAVYQTQQVLRAH